MSPSTSRRSSSGPSTSSPSSSGQAAVEARDLVRSFPGRRALDGVSLSVAAGERFGLLGPNGSGKTTLFRLLATLLDPDSGELEVFGHRVTAEPAVVRRLLGVVFQSPSLDGELTVEENLRCHGRLHGLGGAALGRRVDEELERLGVADRRRDRTKVLSGGLQRRVEIAKALLPRPRLLLLDEPSTGLDPAARRDLRSSLDHLAADAGVTVLLTTHLTDEAAACDRLALLDRGRIVAAGSPAELVAAVGGDVITLVPAGAPGPDAEELVERFPELAGALRPAAEGPGSRLPREVLRLEVPEGHRWIPRLAEAFPGRFDSLTLARPSLEDVFLDRTGRPLATDPRGDHEHPGAEP